MGIVYIVAVRLPSGWNAFIIGFTGNCSLWREAMLSVSRARAKIISRLLLIVLICLMVLLALSCAHDRMGVSGTFPPA